MQKVFSTQLNLNINLSVFLFRTQLGTSEPVKDWHALTFASASSSPDVSCSQPSSRHILWYTPPLRRGGLSLLRERFCHQFAISRHILQLLLPVRKKSKLRLYLSGACPRPRPRPQLNKILRPRPSADAQKACGRVRVRTSLLLTDKSLPVQHPSMPDFSLQLLQR